MMEGHGGEDGWLEEEKEVGEEMEVEEVEEEEVEETPAVIDEL